MHNRLDEIETQLTPKEWAIRLLQEMRPYPDAAAFWKVVSKTEFRDSILHKPFIKLSHKAQARYPGTGRDESVRRIQLQQELQIEFVTWKLFIFRVNDHIQTKATEITFACQLLDQFLGRLKLEDAFKQAAQATLKWLKRRRRAEGQWEAPPFVSLLKALVHVTPALGSEIESSADNLVKLLKDAVAHEASVRIAQERYFDGHPMLFNDVEAALKQAVDLTTKLITEFEVMFPFRQRTELHAVRQKLRSIDLGQLMRDARATATADILDQNGFNGTICWGVARATSEEEYNLYKRHYFS